MLHVLTLFAILALLTLTLPSLACDDCNQRPTENFANYRARIVRHLAKDLPGAELPQITSENFELLLTQAAHDSEFYESLAAYANVAENYPSEITPTQINRAWQSLALAVHELQKPGALISFEQLSWFKTETTEFLSTYRMPVLSEREWDTLTQYFDHLTSRNQKRQFFLFLKDREDVNPKFKTLLLDILEKCGDSDLSLAVIRKLISLPIMSDEQFDRYHKILFSGAIRWFSDMPLTGVRHADLADNIMFEALLRDYIQKHGLTPLMVTNTIKPYVEKLKRQQNVINSPTIAELSVAMINADPKPLRRIAHKCIWFFTPREIKDGF